MSKEIICIGCPMGCRLSVVMEEGKVIKVTGNSCRKGIDYAKSECTNPTRTLTTTVKVVDAMYPLLSVRTSKPIPKGLLADCMKLLEDVTVAAPVEAGRVIVENILDTGADIIATKTLGKTGRNKVSI